MKIKFNYYLKIKKIIGKDFDIFEISEPTTIKDIIQNNIHKDKLDKIDLSEILLIKDGENIENLNTIINTDSTFSVCSKIYGG